MGHNQIHNNCCQENNCNTVLSEDGANDVGENIEHLRDLSEAQTDTQGQCSNGNITLAEATGTDHLQSGNNDITEHHDGAAAQNGLGQGGQDGTEGREEAGQDHNACTGGDGIAVDHLGHGQQAHVLAEGGDGHAAEAGRQG